MGPKLIEDTYACRKEKGTHKAAAFISYLFGGGWLLFCIMDEGFTLGFLIQASPFLLLFLAGYLAKKYPLISGSALILLGIATLVAFVGFANPIIYVKIIMFTLVPFPMILSGVVLVISKFSNKE